MLDYLVISAYLVLLLAGSLLIRPTPFGATLNALFAHPGSAEVTAFGLLVLPIVLYFALLESSTWQASLGKRTLGLHVTDVHGARLSRVRSLGRSGLKFVPWELTHACLWNIPGWPFAASRIPPLVAAGLILVWVLVGVYAVSLLLSKTHQTLYDRIAGAYVVPWAKLRRTGP